MVQTAGVKPMSYGKTQGASLAVRGAKTSATHFLTGDTNWTKLQTDFDISTPQTEIAFLCSLRASAGDAWFDLDSLRLLRITPKN
jgi:hypothetical protein